MRGSRGRDRNVEQRAGDMDKSCSGVRVAGTKHTIHGEEPLALRLWVQCAGAVRAFVVTHLKRKMGPNTWYTCR